MTLAVLATQRQRSNFYSTEVAIQRPKVERQEARRAMVDDTRSLTFPPGQANVDLDAHRRVLMAADVDLAVLINVNNFLFAPPRNTSSTSFVRTMFKKYG